MRTYLYSPYACRYCATNGAITLILTNQDIHHSDRDPWFILSASRGEIQFAARARHVVSALSLLWYRSDRSLLP